MLFQDCQGNTAYDLCCLHGFYECARLLKSLQWAIDKDMGTEQEICSTMAEKNRQQLYRALQEQHQWEVAEEAYKTWLDHRKVLPVTPPSGCKLRSILRVQSSLKSCVTCSQTKSRSVVSTATGRNPHVAKIKISTKQKARNIASVGKPEKMYPFSNYPPRQYRYHTVHPGSSSTINPVQQRRSGSATAGDQVFEGSGKKIKLRTQSAVNQPTQGASTSEIPAHACDIHDSNGVHLNGIEIHAQSPHEREEVNDVDWESHDVSGGNQNNNNRMDGFTTGTELDAPLDAQDDTENTIEGLTFHEVGSENNLKSLSSPGSISPFELFHLLRTSSENSASPCTIVKKHKRSLLLFGAHNSSHTNLSRRVSLSAIPEGEMVTHYSEGHEPSQVFDEEFLYSVMPFAFAASGKDDEQNSQEDVSQLPLVEGLDLETSGNKNAANQGSDLDVAALDPHTDNRNTAQSPTTLKVVNVAWDQHKLEVHQNVTEQALSLRGVKSPTSTRTSSPVGSPLVTPSKTRPASLLLILPSNSLEKQGISSDIVSNIKQVCLLLHSRLENQLRKIVVVFNLIIMRTDLFVYVP